MPPDPLHVSKFNKHDLAPPKVEDNEEYPLPLEIDEYLRRQVNNETNLRTTAAKKAEQALGRIYANADAASSN